MGKKKTVLTKKANLEGKLSHNNMKRKNPLSIIVENEPSMSTPHQRSLPKAVYKADVHCRNKHHESNKKSENRDSSKKRSPNRSSSGKKHRKSKGTLYCYEDYDSPSK